jgi:DNA-binding MarR family transcriptional regulator
MPTVAILQPNRRLGGGTVPGPDDDVLLGLARTVVGISTAAADRLGRISVVQLRALTVLHDLGTATLGDLARGMAVTVSTASRLVDRLVAAGFVVREPSPGSRRALALRMAPAGQEILDRYDRHRLELLQEVLSRLPAAERAAVLAAFGTFAGVARGGLVGVAP